MADAVLTFLRQSLPAEVATLTQPFLDQLGNGDFEGLLQSSEAKALFGHQEDAALDGVKHEDSSGWNDYIFQRLGILLADRSGQEAQIKFFCIGYAALLAFLQSNVTGPPLPFSSATMILPQSVTADKQSTQKLRQKLLEGMSVDGISAYKLTPNLELLCLADAVITCPPILKNVKLARWAKMRVAFMHQRLLSEASSTLQDVIYDDLDLVQKMIESDRGSPGLDKDAEVEFLLERASVHVHHGLDKHARADLEQAKLDHHFQFALTGLLGKRTKFQEKDISQLVVLARSGAKSANGEAVPESSEMTKFGAEGSRSDETGGPANLDLNDDTLLESISFTQKPTDSTKIVGEDALPACLSELDPANQPQLLPLDSTVLLNLASSITNTSPQDGLTREETLPYATRVLDGGSSNWQVYTQALLVRSRIEGYRARTIERGLLQLQAVVDQVIADTTSISGPEGASEEGDKSSTFLPRAKGSESAPASERLRYIFQLASPTRWDLEAELAARWVTLGGLRSALDIYERLEMWAEAALCWAATEREDKARSIVRRQLFTRDDNASTDEPADDETWSGPPREPAPLDAPRLYCILGDIDRSPEMYERAWDVSNQRYARAQRSLGRHWLMEKDLPKAADAYTKSLKANQLNHPSWFALGCTLLELAQFDRAVQAFSRCVQLEATDAESWSNLAAALLRKEPDVDEHTDKNADATAAAAATPRDDEDDSLAPTPAIKSARDEILKNRLDALAALKRAAHLKHNSHRIWQNVLVVSASVAPPDFPTLLAAQKRLIELHGNTDGEGIVDLEILSRLVDHAIQTGGERYDPNQPGLARMVVRFVDAYVVPLITNSAELWRVVGKLALWRNKPSAALDAEEKAWRAVVATPGWETEGEGLWNGVVEATVRLCEAYESLGQRERTEGVGAGELVARDWRFKGRTAVKGVLGRGKASWEGTAGWERLKETMEGLRA